MRMEAQAGLSRCFQHAQVLLLGRWLAAEADAFNTRNAKRAAGVPETEFLAAAAGEAEHLYRRAFQELTRQARLGSGYADCTVRPVQLMCGMQPADKDKARGLSSHTCMPVGRDAELYSLLSMIDPGGLLVSLPSLTYAHTPALARMSDILSCRWPLPARSAGG